MTQNCHDGCRSQTSDVVGQLHRDTATHSLTFRRPSMASSKAMDLSYNLRPQNDAESHQGLSYASHFLCKDNSTATSLPTQAYTSTTDDSLRAQTSQGWIWMRSGQKIARRGGIIRALRLETRARGRPWSATMLFECLQRNLRIHQILRHRTYQKKAWIILLLIILWLISNMESKCATCKKAWCLLFRPDAFMLGDIKEATFMSGNAFMVPNIKEDLRKRSFMMVPRRFFWT